MGLFNKKQTVKVPLYVEPQVDIIDQIHTEFYSEVDILLNRAKMFNEIKNRKPELVDKRNRLAALGFRDTPEMVEADLEIKRLKDLESINTEKQNLIEAINYFSAKYPEYKFITEESVVNICNKYGLVYSTIDNFRGNVPFQNLEQIEKFKIEDTDNCYFIKYKGFLEKRYEKFISIDEYNLRKHQLDLLYFIGGKCQLEICAPLNQFDITDLELQGKKLVKKQVEIKDPIVLCPVFFKNSKHYLIVTAWGKESSDSEVVNHTLN